MSSHGEQVIFPSQDALLSCAQNADVIPIVRILDSEQLDARGIDALGAYVILAPGSSHSALLETTHSGLESGSKDEAISVVVAKTSEIIDGPNALEKARRLTSGQVADVGIVLPQFIGGAVGVISHDHAVHGEKIKRSSEVEAAPQVLPDVIFLAVNECIVFDHHRSRVMAIRVLRIPNSNLNKEDLISEYQAALETLEAIERKLVTSLRPSILRKPISLERGKDPFAEVTSNLEAGEFERMAEQAIEHVRRGECVQMVISQRFDRPSTADPAVVYSVLDLLDPAPYRSLLRLGKVSIVSASPERLVHVANRSRVVTHPIAGTRPRGKTTKEDAELERDLLENDKERSEHMMLVDIGRNDLNRVSVAGSVRVTKLCEVERFGEVMHLVSHVEGELRDGMHPLDALNATFPAGTLVGAPKLRAMQLTAELERARRGVYGGAIGFIGYGGMLNMAITIRTAVIAQGVASVQAGAGIVLGSNPRHEELETRQKARAMLKALAVAEQAVGAA